MAALASLLRSAKHWNLPDDRDSLRAPMANREVAESVALSRAESAPMAFMMA